MTSRAQGLVGLAIWLGLLAVVIVVWFGIIWLKPIVISSIWYLLTGVAVFFTLWFICQIAVGLAFARKMRTFDDINSCDYRGATPLHHAAANGDAELVGLLLVNGADPNATDMLGGTPLLFAVASRNVEVVKLLLQKGAVVDANIQATALSDSTADILELLNGTRSD